MTQSWQDIAARYRDCDRDRRSIRALARLAEQIGGSALAGGLFAWTSMLELCIVQQRVSYPYDGPFLRISPVSEDQLEFRYVDTRKQTRQWHRTVDADEAMARLLKFLDQLRWFPADVLASVAAKTG